MPSLKGRSPNSAYQELLKISNQGAGLDGSLRNIEDGAGNPTGIQIGTGMVAIFGYQFPSSGFASGKVLRVNASNNAFEWHTISASDIPNLSSVATSGHYSDLAGLPTIPTALSQLTNDIGFLTESVADARYSTSTFQLPIATTSIVGGVSVGSGLTVNAQGHLCAAVTSVAGRTGTIALGVSDVNGAAPIDSAALTGSPTAPTATPGSNSTQIATTAFVQSALPTKTSQLTNDSNYVSSAALATVATTGSYNDLANLPIYNFDGGNANTNPLFYQLVVIDGGTQ